MEYINNIISDNVTDEPTIPQPVQPIITPPNNPQPILEQPPIIPQNNKNKNTKFYIISGVLVLFLLTLCYLLAFQSKRITSLLPQKKTTPVPIPTVTVVKTTPTASSKDAYLKMKAEEDHLNTFDEYLVFLNKYGTKEKNEEVNKGLGQINLLPTGFKEQLMSMVKSGSPLLKDITNVDEKVEDNVSLLKITSNNPQLQGTVKLILENGIWKLDSEVWDQSLKPSPSVTP